MFTNKKQPPPKTQVIHLLVISQVVNSPCLSLSLPLSLVFVQYIVYRGTEFLPALNRRNREKFIFSFIFIFKKILSFHANLTFKFTCYFNQLHLKNYLVFSSSSLSSLLSNIWLSHSSFKQNFNFLRCLPFSSLESGQNASLQGGGGWEGGDTDEAGRYVLNIYLTIYGSYFPCKLLF